MVSMKKYTAIVLSVLIFCSSCLGVSADIQLKADGSGRIALEYRFSRMAETIGRLDGNERWNIIPAGRADFERTAARIPGMKIVSFSSRETGSDILNRVTLDFTNTEALLKFLDSSGGASFINNGNSAALNIILMEPVSSEINADLMELMQQVSEGYFVYISFNTDRDAALSITDGTGKIITAPQAVVVPNGRRTSFSIGTGELMKLSLGVGLQLEIRN